MAAQPSVGSGSVRRVRPAIRMPTTTRPVYDARERPAVAACPCAGPARSGRDRSPSSWSCTRPGSASSTCTPSPSAAASAVITDGRAGSSGRRRPSRRRPGTPGRARSSPPRGANDSTRACSSRSPTAADGQRERGRPAPARRPLAIARGTTSRTAQVSANHTVPGSSAPAPSGLSGAAPLVAARGRRGRRPSPRTAWPDEHRRGHQRDLAQGAPGRGGRGRERPRRWPRAWRGCAARSEEQRRGRRHGAKYGPGTRLRTGAAHHSDHAICQARMWPLTCANASGGDSNPC